MDTATCHNKISRKSRGAPTQAIDFTQPNTLESSKSPTEVSNLGGHAIGRQCDACRAGDGGIVRRNQAFGAGNHG